MALGERHGRLVKRWVDSLGLECTEIESLCEKGDKTVVCLSSSRILKPGGAGRGIERLLRDL